MSVPIEHYALIGDTRTVALVDRRGSIDWLCLPRFDAGACFASLLGDSRNGHWQIAPTTSEVTLSRRYRDHSLVLETDFATQGGKVRLVDCMPADEDIPNVVRVVEGIEGEVRMRMELVIRFDYGWSVPWVRKLDGALVAVAGPDGLALRTPVETRGENLTTVAEFTVRAGERVPFVLTWFPSTGPVPAEIDAFEAIDACEKWWCAWASQCTYKGEWSEAVERSLLTLKALTYTPTGGIVAAPTTSLPEKIGGNRNWDYRYGWLRDATYTLYALLVSGFRDEARAWRDWLLRAVAGDPSQLQVMYGVAGERRLLEQELSWLPGYEGSRPVRIGNAAVHQLQLDTYGEVIDALFHARRVGLDGDGFAWSLEMKLLEFLETAWQLPDEGIWEVRGPRQHFTHSKVMAWVAFDRAVKSVEQFQVEGPVDRWRKIRDTIHAEVCERAFDSNKRAFTQSYGSPALDAALLVMPQVGFLPHDDPRIISTVAAIERELLRDGFVIRYLTERGVDGLPPGEGVFLLCTFWLADNYAMTGRMREARALFKKLLAIRNDVGLLAEEYDPRAQRMVGNFPQAFSHVGLINTALNLDAETPSPTRERETRK
ncbi:MAG TPA: glycoside hydrolase family 15 protein [Kofleriaceae bacterium]|nr:glycoside hydrolase family 15 protein [Kofleriaceae bacterium]